MAATLTALAAVFLLLDSHLQGAVGMAGDSNGAGSESSGEATTDDGGVLTRAALTGEEGRPEAPPVDTSPRRPETTDWLRSLMPGAPAKTLALLIKHRVADLTDREREDMIALMGSGLELARRELQGVSGQDLSPEAMTEEQLIDQADSLRHEQLWLSAMRAVSTGDYIVVDSTPGQLGVKITDEQFVSHSRAITRDGQVVHAVILMPDAKHPGFAGARQHHRAMVRASTLRRVDDP